MAAIVARLWTRYLSGLYPEYKSVKTERKSSGVRVDQTMPQSVVSFPCPPGSWALTMSWSLPSAREPNQCTGGPALTPS